jgi:hypothetical protein
VRGTRRRPPWLGRLALARDRLLGIRYPASAAEGFRQVAELSEWSYRLLRGEVGKTMARPTPRRVRTAVHELLARMATASERRKQLWETERARYFAP